MSKINDGGPAFPLENPRHLENGDLFKQFPGMSLRDWFAGQALAGLVTSNVRDCLYGTQSADRYAEDAYCIADAMLAERAKGGA